jgi:prolyl-tRNA synthetase
MLIVTKKSVSSEVEAKSHELALRAGLVNQLGSGLYSFLPLGDRVVKNIEQVVREEIDAIGGLEVSMPIVQPVELWKESGRLDTYGSEMLRFLNREKKEFCFGPTFEEVISQIARELLDSHKQLPFILYQIGRKFRDEKRPRYGLLRCKEFLMKDAYSFDLDVASMQSTYEKFKQAYNRIFTRLNLKYVVVKADPGEIGGSGSEEFLACSKYGEDKFMHDQEGNAIKIESFENLPSGAEGQVGVEIGHIFQLSQVYSKKMKTTFLNKEGQKEFPYMGCYGIGVSRLVSTILDQHHDSEGIIWPKEVAPFDVMIVPVQSTNKVVAAANDIYNTFKANGLKVLIDDRECSAGIKFKDANLLGIPIKAIISEANLDQNIIEFENRRTNEKNKGNILDALRICREIYENDIL